MHKWSLFFRRLVVGLYPGQDGVKTAHFRPASYASPAAPGAFGTDPAGVAGQGPPGAPDVAPGTRFLRWLLSWRLWRCPRGPVLVRVCMYCQGVYGFKSTQGGPRTEVTHDSR